MTARKIHTKPSADWSALNATTENAFCAGSPLKETLQIEIPEDIYKHPSVTQDDPDLIATRDVYNRYCNAKIQYRFGSQVETVDWDTIQGWIRIDNRIGFLREDEMRSFIQDLASKYNTRYLDRIFHTSVGSDIYILGSSNEYGYTIDEDTEFYQLKADLGLNTTIEREPVYVETNSYGNPLYYERDGYDDMAGTYIEANLSRQHLWFYQHGSLIYECDFVSGSVANHAETRTGVFPLAYKESPSILVGDEASGNYRTEVQYWMPFYEGQGLHDAVWRSSFGGEIYRTDGSHGCINLPYDAAEFIFNHVHAGMAIVIYS